MAETIQAWDLMALAWLRQCHDPVAIWLAWLAATLTWKGAFLWSVSIGLLLRGKRMIALQLALALLFAVIEIGALKGTVNRPRPDLYASQQLNIPMAEFLPSAHSFPSGHATLAAAAASTFALRYRGWATWAGAAFVISVGVARVFQGMHWPSDIVGSAVLGMVAALLAIKLSGLPIFSRFLRLKPVSRPSAASPGADQEERIREEAGVGPRS